jgi:coproporphyrinogen III oxidase-like Fe-S oxidoreductase
VTTAEHDFLAAIETSNGDLIPRALSLHVSLPICTDAYFARLERELDLVARLFDRAREVIRIGFDATAPGLVPPTAKLALLRAISTQFHFSCALLNASRDNGPGIGRCTTVAEWDRIGFGAGAASRICDRIFLNTADHSAWEQAIDRGCPAVGPAGRINVTSRHVTTARQAFSGDRR